MAPRPIRVLHLITGLASGGAEMMLYKLVLSMDKSRFESIVVSLGDMGVVGEVIRSAGIPVYTLNIRNYFGLFCGFRKLIGILNTQRPGVLQTWLYHADLLGLLAGKLTKLPVIAWNIRCSELDEKGIPLSTRLVRRLLAKLSAIPNFVVINSEAGRLAHENAGYLPREWVLIANGFDTDKFRPDTSMRKNFRAQLGVTEATPLIGLVARFHPMKGHEIFLKAASKIAAINDRVRFVLVGTGVDETNPYLQSLVRELGLVGKVYLMGYREDVANILPALDIVSLTSLWGEGFPNVVGEAMACAVPCVITDVGDCAKIVGDAGIVVPANDKAALAGAWEKVLNMTDRERAELGFRGRMRVEAQFSLRCATEQYERVYERHTR